MNKPEFHNNKELHELFEKLLKLYEARGSDFLKEWNRLPSFPDMIVDRWNKAKMLGFGEGTNIYDNSLVIGNVQIGKECWVGPNTILDGSGDLFIGDNCTVSAGVHIYTHDNVKQTLSSKKLPIERMSTRIGNNVYIGPNSVITKGVTIGSNVVIGSFALVNRDVSDNSIVIGQPARVVGNITIANDGNVAFNYFNE